MFTAEEYKDIPGYEGLYQISKTGKIKSLPKTWDTTQCIRTSKEIVLKQSKDSKGYFKVTLSKSDRTHKTERVHRLLAITYIPNPENKTCINHIDGNKENNSLQNLEWCTFQENNAHAQKTGLNNARYSKKQKEAARLNARKRRLLTDEQIQTIKELRKTGLGSRRISNITGIKTHLIDYILYRIGDKANDN